MILALASTDARLEKRVVEYLEARSIYHLDVSGNVGVLTGEELDPTRHYVLTGVADERQISGLRARADFRLVFIGATSPLEAGAKGLAEIASLRIATDGDEDLERLKSAVIEAMSSFARPGWDEYFMQIAKVAARRSNCMKRQVAAVVVRDHRIVTTGYNGTPRGARNCNEGGCPRCNSLAPSGAELDECLCNHAEENAIAQAAFHGISIKGATIYCTLSPCLRCTKLIINGGITEVVYDAQYPLSSRSLTLLEECGVKVRQFP